VVSFWSGVAPAHTDPAVARYRLLEGCQAVLDAAGRRGVTLGFEPEPGMLVDSLDGYEKLRAALGAPPHFGLTLDLGHCQCTEPQPPAGCIARAAPWLVNVHIEDMRRGVHEHLDFGEGEIDFPAALAALRAVGYQRLVSVELPRHSHAAHVVAPRAIEFLRQAEHSGARP
jgi:L-ribulose-5-phosphate 3-epimerase